MCFSPNAVQRYNFFLNYANNNTKKHDKNIKIAIFNEVHYKSMTPVLIANDSENNVLISH